MHVYIYIYIYTHIHTHTHTICNIIPYIYIYIYIHTYIYTHTYSIVHYRIWNRRMILRHPQRLSFSKQQIVEKIVPYDPLKKHCCVIKPWYSGSWHLFPLLEHLWGLTHAIGTPRPQLEPRIASLEKTQDGLK